jgi:hypothetical protein
MLGSALNVGQRRAVVDLLAATEVDDEAGACAPSGRAIDNDMRFGGIAGLDWRRTGPPTKRGSWCFRCVTLVGEPTNTMT